VKLIETQVREAIANGTIGERVWLYANYHCNLACRYCLTSSSPSVPRRELDATVMLALANDAVRRMVDEKLRVERTCERNQSRAEIFCEGPRERGRLARGQWRNEACFCDAGQRCLGEHRDRTPRDARRFHVFILTSTQLRLPSLPKVATFDCQPVRPGRVTPSMSELLEKTGVLTKGYAATSTGNPLAPFSFNRCEARANDIVIDIKFCGICHSDIHQVRNEWGGAKFPLVPGHEIAGTVASVGSKVTQFKVGDHVGVGCFVDSCRECAQCKAGTEQYCTGLVQTYNDREKDGTPTMGGYSERIVVDEKYVLRIPENIPLDAAAPLLCAGITLYSPLKHWKAGPGKKVAIVGLGGLGHMGIKLAHALGAEVTVLSQSLSKEADGKRLGADHYYATSDPQTFTKLAGKFDLIINTVSASLDWNQYASLLVVDGTLIVVGIPEKPIPINAFALVHGRRSIGFDDRRHRRDPRDARLLEQTRHHE